jgi:hypothetical protein
MLEIEDLEVSLGQGPCLEAYETGTLVTADDLRRCRDRWPQFTDRIVELGMRSAYAFHCGSGTTASVRSTCTARRPRRSHHARSASDRHSRIPRRSGSWQERAVFAAERRSEQLQRALNSRITIEQAKGILAERHGLRPGEAFSVL